MGRSAGLAVVLLAFSAAVCVVFGTAAAESERKQSILYTPDDELTFYELDWSRLSSRMRWRRKIHGLRMVPLDPRVWTIRSIDRTDNRILIPIRPFFLKASEAEDFRLDSIGFNFAFGEVTPAQMKSTPEAYAPVLDVGFAGEFVLGQHGRRPLVDRGYTVRLSVFPRAPSGILFRSHMSSVPAAEGEPRFVQSKKNYRVEIRVSAERAVVTLDGKPFAEVKGRRLNCGLVSLISGWHPVYIKNLEVSGHRLRSGEKEPLKFSGLAKGG